jgi:transposase
MPKRDHILNLPGFSITKVVGYNPLVLEVNYRRKARCPDCQQAKVRKKATFIRQVRHELIGLRPTILRIKAHKFYCPRCQRYFNQQFPGIGKYQRATERLRSQVFHHHTQGVSQKDLARDVKLGKATIERWYHQHYQREYAERQNDPCPSVLGIDEHFFSRKQGFVTTFCDLKNHKIFDIVKGYSEQTLKSYLQQLPHKDRVKVICIDLCSRYRQVIRQYFPKAKIVADRFHVIRLLYQQCMQTYHSIDPTIKYQRGILAALRTKTANLTSKRLQKRNAYFQQQPAIEAVYKFKQQLYGLLMLKTKKVKHCKHYLPIFLNALKQLKESPFKSLATLGKTLNAWQEEIVRMWRFSKNNGITEGFHRKMKLIQRRAYGFRNFENYRLRVKVLCS